jgi:hypothetical protein
LAAQTAELPQCPDESNLKEADLNKYSPVQQVQTRKDFSPSLTAWL